jgi:hypothetical protein
VCIYLLSNEGTMFAQHVRVYTVHELLGKKGQSFCCSAEYASLCAPLIFSPATHP